MKHKAGTRLLAALVAMLLAVTLCVRPVVQAKAIAVVDDLVILGVVAALLTGVGVTFATSEDLQRGASAAYQQGSAAFRGLVDDLKEHLGPLGTVMSVTPSVFYTVWQNAQKVFPGKAGTAGVLPSGDVQPLNRDNAMILDFSQALAAGMTFMPGKAFQFVAYPKGTNSKTMDVSFEMTSGSIFMRINGTSVGTGIGGPTGTWAITNFSIRASDKSSDVIQFLFEYRVTKADGSYYDGKWDPYLTYSDVSRYLGVNYTTGGRAAFAGVVDVGTGSVSTPTDVGYEKDKSICIDGLIAAGIEEYIKTHTNDKVIDIATYPDPEDYVRVDWRDVILTPEWKKAMNDAFEGGDFGGGGATRPFPELPSGGGGGGSSSEPDTPGGGGSGTDDPIGSPDDLKFPDLTLPERIFSVFPFSIPWDIKRGLELLCTDPVAPRWEIPFKIDGLINEVVVLDLSKYEDLIELFRYFEGFLFTLGTALMTRRVIKW